MAVAPKGQGAGVSTETSGAALSPQCPATVDAGDVLILHVYWEGTTSAPSPPGDWVLLNPGGAAFVIQSTIGRQWFYGKIAAGTEDGAAIACGAPAVTTQRGARIYSYSGRVSGAIADLIGGITHTSHATDPQGPSVTTPIAGALAVALVAQNDNNTIGAFTGQSGGTWNETVAEYVAALTPGLMLQAQHCTPTSDPGTVSGGTFNTANDPVGVIGFYIRPSATVATASDAGSGSYGITGADATAPYGRNSNGEAGAYSIGGAAAEAASVRSSNAETSSYSVSGAEGAAARGTPSNAELGAYNISGADAAGRAAFGSDADGGSYALTGADAAAQREVPSNAETGAYTLAGADVQDAVSKQAHAESGTYTLSGAAATGKVAVVATGEPGTYEITGTDTTDEVSGPQAIESSADPGSYYIHGAYNYSGVAAEGVSGSAGFSPSMLEKLRRKRQIVVVDDEAEMLQLLLTMQQDEDPF